MTPRSTAALAAADWWWPRNVPGPLPAASRPLASITAVLQDVFPPRVLITVTGLTTYNADHVTLYRQVAGVRTIVRGADNVATGGNDAFVRTDAELPFGVPVTYVAAITAGGATFEILSIPVTAAIAKVALTDAITGRAAQVVILAWPDKETPRVSTGYTVGGRVVVVSGPRPAGPASVVELFTETDSARDNLEALLASATAGVIQLRCEDPIKYADVDAYLAVLADVITRFSQDGTDQRRRIALTVQEVEGWPAFLEARGFTWADVNAAYNVSWAAFNGVFATWLDVAQASFFT